MFYDGKSYVCICSLLQRSMHEQGSKEHLEWQLCTLSFSTLQTVENVSMYVPFTTLTSSTLLQSCIPGGGVKFSKAGVAIIEVDAE